MEGPSDIGLHPEREHLILALDVAVAAEAVALVRALRPWFAVAKVGLELFAAAGPDVVRAVRDEGVDVFVDLKLHDIPNTVRRAAHVIGAGGARYLTVHASGGPAMVRAGLEGFTTGAREAGHSPPILLAVTVLTSDATAGRDTFDARVQVARDAGSPGLVCSAPDVARAKELYPAAVAVCPGVRPAGVGHDDQARVATPGGAVAAGADLIVVGRAVTGVVDPMAAARAVADEIAVTRSSAAVSRPPGTSALG